MLLAGIQKMLKYSGCHLAQETCGWHDAAFNNEEHIVKTLLKFLKVDAIILLFVCSFFLIKAQAETASADLANLLNSIHTMQADFVQTVYDNRGKAIQQSHGHMTLKRPNKFRWQIQKPVPQLIIANQARLWIYDPDLEQVTVRALGKTSAETPALVLSHNNIQLDNDYVVTAVAGKSANSHWFKLIPKQADSMFEFIRMGFNNGAISDMELKDHLGHSTQIQFKNTKINIAVAENLFTFKAPANVDVIDETRKKRG